MNPNAMPSVMLKLNGIITKQRNAGIASVMSSHLMLTMGLSIKQPTMISVGPITG